jgi:hypothetical protein
VAVTTVEYIQTKSGLSDFESSSSAPDKTP